MERRVTHDDLMRYLDGETLPEERERIDAQLARSSELQRELAVFRAMKDDLQDLSFVAPGRDGSVWDHVNRRIARPLGWVFLLAGTVVWLVYGVFLYLTSAVQLFEKMATSAVGIGILLLLATVIWERYRELPTDPYRDVHR